MCVGAQHLGARTPADKVFDDQVARVEKGLRADPDIVADHAGAIEAALDIGLGADEDALADLESLRVLEPGTGWRPGARAPQRRATPCRMVRRIMVSTRAIAVAKRP